MSKDLVLLTGATGFVGTPVLKRLLDTGYAVRVITRRPLDLDYHDNGRLEVIECEDLFLRGSSWWLQTSKGVSTVIHTAWYVNPDDYLNSRENLACLTGTIEMAKGCLDSGVERFIGIGSCFEYDLTSAVPISVSCPLDPTSIYAASKVSTYYALKSLFEEAKMIFIWARLFYLFGPNENERRLVPYIRNRIRENLPVKLSAGAQVRDYINSIDAAVQLSNLVECTESGCYNICSGKGVTIRDLANAIADEFGRRDLLEFGAIKEKRRDPAVIVGIPGNSERGEFI